MQICSMCLQLIGLNFFVTFELGWETSFAVLLFKYKQQEFCGGEEKGTLGRATYRSTALP